MRVGEMSGPIKALAIGVPVVIVLAVVGTLAGDDEPTVTPAEARHQAAVEVWDELVAAGRAGVCDSLRTNGEVFTLEVMTAAADGDDELGESLLLVAKSRC